MKNITTYGMELEFFAVVAPGKENEGQVTFFPAPLASLMDDCGYLLEARGEKANNPDQARWNLHKQIRYLTKQASAQGLMLENLDTKDIAKEHLRLCMRQYGKNAAQSYFMGGHVYKSTRPRAGLHLHFGTERMFKIPDKVMDNEIVTGGAWTVAEICNMPRIIALLDKAFREEIKAAKRMPGEYEVKSYGFEYRSLPATSNLDKVVDVIERMTD